MYSVVMMVALSGAPVTVDRCRGCHGCCGCYGCYGCYGCHGCWGGWACHGCWGCWGCYGCWGGCWGCCGGCYGYSSYGMVTYRPTVVVNGGVARQQSDSSTATVVVSLPAEAKLTINGWTSKNATTSRRFRSPPLESGKDYFYTVRAELVRDGQTIVQTREVSVRAGQESRVPFDFAATAVTQNQTNE